MKAVYSWCHSHTGHRQANLSGYCHALFLHPNVLRLITQRTSPSVSPKYCFCAPHRQFWQAAVWKFWRIMMPVSLRDNIKILIKSASVLCSNLEHCAHDKHKQTSLSCYINKQTQTCNSLFSTATCFGHHHLGIRSQKQWKRERPFLTISGVKLLKNSDDCYYENDKTRTVKDYLLSRQTNAQFIYMLHIVTTATCFDAAEWASDSSVLVRR